MWSELLNRIDDALDILGRMRGEDCGPAPPDVDVIWNDFQFLRYQVGAKVSPSRDLRELYERLERVRPVEY